MARLGDVTSHALMVQARGMGTVLDQFGNADNPLGHYTGTGPELWEQTNGRITHFVSSMGTTGMPAILQFGRQRSPCIRPCTEHQLCNVLQMPAERFSSGGRCAIDQYLHGK